MRLNRLSGGIDPIATWSLLRNLDVSNNLLLTGTIPTKLSTMTLLT